MEQVGGLHPPTGQPGSLGGPPPLSSSQARLPPVTVLYQTLSIWLGIQFRQRYGQIKDRRPKNIWNIFGLA